MRAFLIVAILVAAAGFWTKSIVQNGALERFLDAHPHAQINPSLEYYWAFLLNISRHTMSADYRYGRVIEKYPDSKYAPRASLDLIELVDSDRSRVMAESRGFLEKYPKHPKAELIRKKLEVMEHGI